MAEELRIVIGADIKDLEKEIAKARKDLDKFAKKVNQGGGATDKFGKQVKGNAVPAVQEFSRVIQDAPFGIQGVANNITQLTAQFGNLSKNAGGTKAALKAMLGTLAGPAGILLAVSAVTSLLVSFGDELKNAVSSTNALADATRDFTASAQNEISKLTQLVKIAKDENNSKQVRERAIKAINKDYSKYLGNLDSESIKTQAVTDKINALSKALLVKAKIRGAESVLEEKFKELAEQTNEVIEQSGVTSRNKATEAIRNAKREKAALESLLSTLKEQQKSGADVSDAIQDVTNKIELLSKASKLTDFEGLAEGFLSERIKSETADIEREISQLESVLQSFLKDSFKSLDLDGGGSGGGGDNTIRVKVKPIIESNTQGVTNLLDDLLTGFEGNLDVGLEKFKQVNSQVLEQALLFSEGVTSVFDSLGQNIANSLVQTSGVFGAFVGTVIQESLKLVSQLIANSIKGTAVTAAQTAKQIALNKAAATSGAIAAAAQTAAASGPGAAFLLPGLIAAAVAAIGAAFSGIGGGGGGSVGGSGSVNNSSAVNTSFGGGLGSGNQRVVFEIAGRKLLGVLRNEVTAGSRIGDAIGLG